MSGRPDPLKDQDIIHDNIINDEIDMCINIVMIIVYFIPSMLILRKYEVYMDKFTRWMIIIFNIGFLGKLNDPPLNSYS
jgi:hypothetical protein